MPSLLPGKFDASRSVTSPVRGDANRSHAGTHRRRAGAAPPRTGGISSAPRGVASAIALTGARVAVAAKTFSVLTARFQGAVREFFPLTEALGPD